MSWRYRVTAGLDAVNLHLHALESAGLLGLVEEDGRTDAYFRAKVDGLPLPGTWHPVPQVDWTRAWRQGLHPVRVGALTVSPPWLAAPGDVVIEPAQAFGTGHHETTASCLRALQGIDLGGRSVLDVGTGTGVLAISARRLGARHVVAVDPDPEAVAAARANALANHVDVEVRQGSLDAATGVFAVVVANLDTATVCDLAGGLAERLEPAGTLVVSGVGVERAPEAAGALAAAGLDCAVELGAEWALLVCTRPGKHETPGGSPRGFGGAGPP